MTTSEKERRGWIASGSRHLTMRVIDAAIGALVAAAVGWAIEKLVRPGQPFDSADRSR